MSPFLERYYATAWFLISFVMRTCLLANIFMNDLLRNKVCQVPDGRAEPNTRRISKQFPAVSIVQSVWVGLWPLPLGYLSSSESRLHYWTGQSGWLLLTSCHSSLNPVYRMCGFLCWCELVFVHLFKRMTPSDLFPTRKLNPLWDFFPLSERFSFITSPALPGATGCATTNSQTSFGSIYLVDRSAEWLLLLSRPQKNHSN